MCLFVCLYVCLYVTLALEALQAIFMVRFQQMRCLYNSLQLQHRFYSIHILITFFNISVYSKVWKIMTQICGISTGSIYHLILMNEVSLYSLITVVVPFSNKILL